jgi:type 1 glutamine amidotransferase
MKVLFSRQSAGYEHAYLPNAEVAVKRLGRKCGAFEAVTTACSDLITAEHLAAFDAIVLATSGDLGWSEEQKAGFLSAVRSGTGVVGVHNATTTYGNWPEFVEMLGGRFVSHPWRQEFAVRVEDTGHPAVAMLGGSFRVTDEVYVMEDWDRSKTHVLMSLDNDSVDISKGPRADRDYALGWCHPYGEGRVVYTAFGHFEELWDERWFLDHLLGCIRWAAGRS